MNEETKPAPQRRAATAYALIYAHCLPTLVEIARMHGYALGVHGSMATDLDLIAVPWMENAEDPDDLIEAIRKAVHGRLVQADTGKYFAEKPHGRRAYSILPPSTWELPREAWSPWLDISVIPCLGMAAQVDVYAGGYFPHLVNGEEPTPEPEAAPAPEPEPEPEPVSEAKKETRVWANPEFPHYRKSSMYGSGS